MADMEKVLKGLEHCSEMNGENCSRCPYQNESLGHAPTCTGHLAHDALKLLKEYAVIKETLSDGIHETAKMFRREG